MNTKIKPHNVVYSPNDVATLGTEYVDWKQNHKEFGLNFLSKKMSDRVYPLFPGEMMSIIARPGHAKTSFMMAWARRRSAWLKDSGHTERVVVYSTWEQSVEELHSFYIAAEQKLSITKMAKGELSTEDWKKVKDASVSRLLEPLWFIGHSVMRKSGRQPINTDALGDAIEKIQGWNGEGKIIDCLFVDYLQRIPPTSKSDNVVVAYSNTVDELKNLALGFGIPIVVGVQASRDVEAIKAPGLPIPEMNHAQWTSNIEQSSDRVLALVRPRRYRKEGEKFGSVMVSGNNQLLVGVLKQKLGEANFSEWLSFNPIYNRLDDKELENPVPDD